MKKPTALKLKVGQRETHEIDGMSVELRRVDVRRYDWDYRHTRKEGEPFGHPKEQALLEIWIDGKFVGRASRAHGFGKQSFTIERLGTEHYRQCLGHQVVWSDKHGSGKDILYTSADVARKAAELRREKRWGGGTILMTEKEVQRALAAEKAEEERREREAEENRVKWAREAAERKQAAEEQRGEVVMGLESIKERHDALTLSNLEMAALDAAIKRYKEDVIR